MQAFPFDGLRSADLFVDAVYHGGRKGNAGDDPFPRLLSMSNQGGFRYRGDIGGKLEMLLLTSTFTDPDWPDELDRETGIFTYYGDNKRPGRALHETGRGGNQLLRRIFEDASYGQEGRVRVPPIFLFGRLGAWRDVTFLGLAVPGAAGPAAQEDLVAVWRTASNSRFQNYRARFTVLDAPSVDRKWIDSLVRGNPDDTYAPAAWKEWRDRGRRVPLVALRSIEHRTPAEQIPSDSEGQSIIRTVREHFSGRPHDFEHCAAALARLMMPDTAALDVTRSSRDGGRDAIGQLRVGWGAASILMDFALEAKCYTPPAAVGVSDISRLISRLRHRQFGVLVTTTWLQLQAYREIKEDQHPIIVIAGADIAALLRANGRGTAAAVQQWLDENFPPPERDGNVIIPQPVTRQKSAYPFLGELDSMPAPDSELDIP